MRYPLLLLLVLFSGCSLFGDGETTISAYATEVTVAAVHERTVAFDYSGWLPDPCWEFARVELYRSDTSTVVDLRYRGDGSSVCPDVLGGDQRKVVVRTAERGPWTFLFPSSPSNHLAVEVTVP